MSENASNSQVEFGSPGVEAASQSANANAKSDDHNRLKQRIRGEFVEIRSKGVSHYIRPYDVVEVYTQTGGTGLSYARFRDGISALLEDDPQFVLDLLNGVHAQTPHHTDQPFDGAMKFISECASDAGQEIWRIIFERQRAGATHAELLFAIQPIMVGFARSLAESPDFRAAVLASEPEGFDYDTYASGIVLGFDRWLSKAVALLAVGEEALSILTDAQRNELLSKAPTYIVQTMGQESAGTPEPIAAEKTAAHDPMDCVMGQARPDSSLRGGG